MLTPCRLGTLAGTVCLMLCLVPTGAGAQRSCASHQVRPRLIHHAAPPQRLLSSLSVLRRPQESADLQGFELSAGFPSLVTGLVSVPGMAGSALATASVIDADYIRKVGFVGGRPEYVAPARVLTVAPISRRCLRRLSLKAHRYQLKLERADRARGVVLLFSGSILTYSELISGAQTGVLGGAPPVIPGALPIGAETPTSASTEFVFGIVPDGVSSVTLRSEDNPDIMAPVAVNFFSIEVPASFHHGSATVIWRDATGRTLPASAEGPFFLPE